MKGKRLLITALALAIFGSTAAYANDVAEYVKARAVKVKVNGSTLKSDGLLVTVGNETKTYLPLRDIADTLQAVVIWEDGKPVEIYKPNVHISFMQPRKDGSYALFGIVHPNEKYTFLTQIQIDSLMTNLYGWKVEIVDPQGNVVAREEKKLTAASTSGVVWDQIPVTLQVNHAGLYMVKVFMKTEEKGDYSFVSEKALLSERKN